MERKQIVHLLHIPWTGLGLYNGFRGNRWLKNRIKVFKQFVVPSLINQTSKNFMLWCAWRPEEKNNKHVKELMRWLDDIKYFKVVHTFHGICFWDDKYKDEEARKRLFNALHGSLAELINHIGECDYVYMTIQPSDDLYSKYMVQNVQAMFENSDLEGIGFKAGYICNYQTKEVCEYNPTTNPPFYTIKFPRDTFLDPLKHFNYTAIKQDMGKYKAGTPIPSHEYVGGAIKYSQFDVRGFMVGTHGENISTVFNHPFKGAAVDNVLEEFGIADVEPLKIKFSIRKRLLRLLPFRWQRKIRYIFGERGWQKIYDFLRN